jgi:hypothetical protein
MRRPDAFSRRFVQLFNGNCLHAAIVSQETHKFNNGFPVLSRHSVHENSVSLINLLLNPKQIGKSAATKFENERI